MEREPKPVRWVGSSRRDLRAFPAPVRRDIGQAVYAAQWGEEYPSVKALQGFGGFPEEVKEGHIDTQKGNRLDKTAACGR